MEQYEKIAVMGLGDVGRSAVDEMKEPVIKGVKFITPKERNCSLSLATSLAGTDIFFLGTAPDEADISQAVVCADTARRMGILTFGVALLSQNDDMENIKALKNAVDAIIMFSVDYCETRRVVEFISDLLNNAGFINLEFSDINTILSNAGYVAIGSGMGRGEERAERAARNALQTLSERIALNSTTRIIMSVTSGADVTLMEIVNAAEVVKKSVSSDARIALAHTLDDEVGDRVRVTLLVNGRAVASLSNQSGVSLL